MWARHKLGRLLANIARAKPEPKDKGGRRPQFRDYLKQIGLAETSAKEAQRIGTLPDADLEQRKFVLWWDEQEKQAGSLKRGTAPASAVIDAGLSVKDFGLDRDTIHRWRYCVRLAETKLSSSSFQNFVP